MILEQDEPFSSSQIWALQRAYFEQMGFEAWRQGEVPHYVTTNPRIANSYAEIIFALHTDTAASGTDEPFYIIEAGAGSGRFAFYLLKRLVWLCEQAGIDAGTFRYVITDFTQSNADFWREHPCLLPFIDKGLLDMAILDLTREQDIELQVSGQTLGPGSLSRPVTVVANYLFDSIPQALFYCKDGQAAPCLVTLSSEEDISGLSPAQQLQKLQVTYRSGETAKPYYTEPFLEKLLDQYRNGCNGAYVLFPDAAIRGLKHLSSFSKNGMMLLTADKGEHIPLRVLYREPPGLIHHGSFSFTVNFHALSLYCTASGGTALFPEHKHGSINTGCLLFMNNAVALKSVHIMYRKFIAEAGPDDYYSVFSQLHEQAEKMPLAAVLSTIRVSLYDSHLLNRFLTRLSGLAGDMTEMDRIDVINLLNRCWDNYYPLGEYNDLANRIALLLYEMDVYDWAIYYFNLSIRIYGDDTGTLFNVAACYYQLGNVEKCRDLLQKVLDHDPSNDGASALMKRLESIPDPTLRNTTE